MGADPEPANNQDRRQVLQQQSYSNRQVPNGIEVADLNPGRADPVPDQQPGVSPQHAPPPPQQQKRWNDHPRCRPGES